MRFTVGMLTSQALGPAGLISPQLASGMTGGYRWRPNWTLKPIEDLLL